jgi:hypothetical protein
MHFGKVGCLFLRCLYIASDRLFRSLSVKCCSSPVWSSLRIKLFSCLPLVFALLVSKSEDPRCTSFADYILENYIVKDSRFPPTLWSSLPSLNAKRTVQSTWRFKVQEKIMICESTSFTKHISSDLDVLTVIVLNASWTSIMHFGKVGCLFLRCLYIASDRFFRSLSVKCCSSPVKKKKIFVYEKAFWLK